MLLLVLRSRRPVYDDNVNAFQEKQSDRRPLVRHFVTCRITRVGERLALSVRRRFHDRGKSQEFRKFLSFFSIFRATLDPTRVSVRVCDPVSRAHVSLFAGGTDRHVDQRSEAFPDISRIPDVAARRLRLTDCRCVYMRTFHVNSLFGAPVMPLTSVGIAWC